MLSKDVGEYNWHPDFDSSLLAPFEVQHVAVIGLRDAVPSHLWGSVLLLGNFDSLHVGHRSLLNAARRHAAILKAPVGIMSCEPHPKQFFNPDCAPFRLSSEDTKRFVCDRLGIDLLFMPRFDVDFASLSPHDFAVHLLAGQLGVKAVVVGEDFHFGKGRSGSVKDLERFGTLCDFDTIVVQDLVLEGERISSTRVRRWIESGDMDKVNAVMQGRWVTKVTTGEGKMLTFQPGAILPPAGFYHVSLWNEQGYSAGLAKVELLPRRVAQLLDGEVSSGAYLVSDWTCAD